MEKYYLVDGGYQCDKEEILPLKQSQLIEVI